MRKQPPSNFSWWARSLSQLLVLDHNYGILMSYTSPHSRKSLNYMYIVDIPFIATEEPSALHLPAL